MKIKDMKDLYKVRLDVSESFIKEVQELSNNVRQYNVLVSFLLDLKAQGDLNVPNTIYTRLMDLKQDLKVSAAQFSNVELIVLNADDYQCDTHTKDEDEDEEEQVSEPTSDNLHKTDANDVKETLGSIAAQATKTTSEGLKSLKDLLGNYLPDAEIFRTEPETDANNEHKPLLTQDQKDKIKETTQRGTDAALSALKQVKDQLESAIKDMSSESEEGTKSEYELSDANLRKLFGLNDDEADAQEAESQEAESQAKDEKSLEELLAGAKQEEQESQSQDQDERTLEELLSEEDLSSLETIIGHLVETVSDEGANLTGIDITVDLQTKESSDKQSDAKTPYDEIYTQLEVERLKEELKDKSTKLKDNAKQVAKTTVDTTKQVAKKVQASDAYQVSKDTAINALDKVKASDAYKASKATVSDAVSNVKATKQYKTAKHQVVRSLLKVVERLDKN